MEMTCILIALEAVRIYMNSEIHRYVTVDPWVDLSAYWLRSRDWRHGLVAKDHLLLL